MRSVLPDRGRSLVFLQTAQLQKGVRKKLGAIDHHAMPQSPRLVQKTPSPLEAPIADPSWRPFHFSADELEGGSDGHNYWNVQAGAMLVDPAFLLGQSETYPQNIRRCPIDEIHDLRVLFAGELPEGRRISAYGRESWESLSQLVRQRGQNFFRVAVKEVPVARCAGNFAELPKQVGATN